MLFDYFNRNWLFISFHFFRFVGLLPLNFKPKSKSSKSPAISKRAFLDWTWLLWCSFSRLIFFVSLYLFFVRVVTFMNSLVVGGLMIFCMFMYGFGASASMFQLTSFLKLTNTLIKLSCKYSKEGEGGSFVFSNYLSNYGIMSCMVALVGSYVYAISTYPIYKLLIYVPGLTFFLLAGLFPAIILRGCCVSLMNIIEVIGMDLRCEKLNIERIAFRIREVRYILYMNTLRYI